MRKKKINVKKDIKEEWKDGAFKILVISSFLLVIGLFFKKFTEGDILLTLLILWFFSFSRYEIFNKRVWSKNDIFSKFYTIYIALLMLSFIILYFLITIKRFLPFAPLMIVLIFLIAFFYSIILFIFSHKNIFLIILTYTLAAFLTIFLFTAGFPITSNLYDNAIINLENNKTIDTFDHFYFSGTTFYTSSYGDFLPIGKAMRTIVIIELWWGIVMHVILLGWLISKYVEKK